jgi:hypothetical protein
MPGQVMTAPTSGVHTPLRMPWHATPPAWRLLTRHVSGLLHSSSCDLCSIQQRRCQLRRGWAWPSLAWAQHKTAQPGASSGENAYTLAVSGAIKLPKACGAAAAIRGEAPLSFCAQVRRVQAAPNQPQTPPPATCHHLRPPRV